MKVCTNCPYPGGCLGGGCSHIYGQGPCFGRQTRGLVKGESDPKRRLIKMAKLLCEADGEEPNVLVTRQQIPISNRGVKSFRPQDWAPQWRLYLSQAQRLTNKLETDTE